jgi:hypothetical protein
MGGVADEFSDGAAATGKLLRLSDETGLANCEPVARPFSEARVEVVVAKVLDSI